MTAYQLWEQQPPGVPFGIWAETEAAQAAITAEQAQGESGPGATWSPEPALEPTTKLRPRAARRS